jgi:uncharacterized membrane protein
MATMIIGTLPFAESRVAVPVAITYFKMHPVLAVMYASMGDLIPTIFIINLIGPVSGFLVRHFKIAERFFHWLFEHTRHKFVGKYEKYGILALILFVAIPIPGSGSWAGSLASFIFGIEKKKAFVSIAIGVVIAGTIISLITTGVLGFLNILI